MNNYISVITIAHDRKKYIIDAINSVLKQNLDKDLYEIIVVKNFKDDKIDKFLEDNGISKNFITEEKGVGKKAAIGVDNSSGDVICFLDDDDMFRENKLSTVINAFSRISGLVYYHNNQIKIDEDGKILDNPQSSKNEIISQISEKSIAFVFRNFGEFNSSSICLNREVLDTKMLRKLDRAVDYFYLLSALKSSGKLMLDFTPLTYYRVHKSAMHFISNSFKEIIESACRYYYEQSKAKEIIHEYFKDNSLLEKITKADFYTFNAISSILCGKSKFLPIKYSIKVLDNPIYFPSFRAKLFLASILNLISNNLAKEIYARMYLRRFYS
ncbi:glycosyltransferase family A protein [Acidianus sp. HS-5]|uniref:glycosyltransferase family 2 protein n=1 Tax=Acidianus sp. HS-5 TaxID=2886040 RepID=UPI001F3A6802|nr:glycosyltransferase family A protein [Acidianus sp. HS-5]BDC18431.1 hypothetical protein HS5_13210 [Acidianus sp. HS-5]